MGNPLINEVWYRVFYSFGINEQIRNQEAGFANWKWPYYLSTVLLFPRRFGCSCCNATEAALHALPCEQTLSSGVFCPSSVSCVDIALLHLAGLIGLTKLQNDEFFRLTVPYVRSASETSLHPQQRGN